jgi:hypothetical protein
MLEYDQNKVLNLPELLIWDLPAFGQMNGGGLKEEESGVLRNSYKPVQTTPITAEVEAEAEGHGA